MSTLKKAWEYFFSAVKWLPAAALIGLAGGAAGVVFSFAVQRLTAFRLSHGWMVYLLPVGAPAVLLIYRLFRLSPDVGTNLVLESVRSKKQVPLTLAPSIALGTVASHFFGGSVGRTGAALQIGGSIAGGIAKALRIRDESARRMLVLCGMAAAFSILFGTPVTATLFVLEVVSVGRFYYFAMLPCLTASLVAFGLSRLAGVELLRMTASLTGGVTPAALLRTAALAVLCALLSIVFCVVVHRTKRLADNFLKNRYLRALVLGTVILGMTLLAGSQTYNGAGTDLVRRAVAGENISRYAFALKLIFTAISLAAGYKGGEVAPTFFVGATFGAVAGPLLGLDAGFGAAIGMVALFCGVVNCPFASMFLAVEIFGGEYLIPFAVTCALSYILSGYFGLYSSQQIVRSKVGTELLDREIGE